MWETFEVSGNSIAALAAENPHAPPAALLSLPDRNGFGLTKVPEQAVRLQEAGITVLEPQVDGCWWFDVKSESSPFAGTALQFLRDSLIPEAARRWNVAPPQIAVLGFGSGGQGALNLTYRDARRFPIVAALSPAVDFYTVYNQGLGIEDVFPSAEAARQQSATLHIHPLNWPKHQWFACNARDNLWFEGSEKLASKLMSMGIPFDVALAPSSADSHEEYWREMLPQAVDFILARLANAG